MLESQALFIRIHPNLISILECPVHQFRSQWAQNIPLNDPLERPCSEHWVVTFTRKELFGSIREMNLDLSFRQPVLEVLKLNFHDAFNLLCAQWVENNDVIYPVQKFG